VADFEAVEEDAVAAVADVGAADVAVAVGAAVRRPM